MITQRSLYGGTDHFITKDLPPLGIEHTKVDSGDARTFKGALRPNTKASCLPLQPLLRALRPICCACVWTNVPGLLGPVSTPAWQKQPELSDRHLPPCRCSM